MENGRALAERLQWHEHCMTSSGEQSNKNDVRAGFREWWLALSVSLGTALLVIAPFFWLGIPSGPDFGFNPASWLTVPGHWEKGPFFSRGADGGNTQLVD